MVGRQWNDGDEVVLVLPLEPRFTVADPRLDAARGAVAVEYGPLVYCLEAVDNPGHRLDDLTIDTAVAPEVVPTDGPLQGVASIRIGGRVRPRTGASWWPYRPADASTGDKPGQSVPLTAVPYFSWGNRGPARCGSGCPRPRWFEHGGWGRDAQVYVGCPSPASSESQSAIAL